MKKIENYLHLYIGCEVAAPNPYDDYGVEITKGVLTGIHGEYGPEIQFIIDGNAEEAPDYVEFIKVKPILRRLSSMTHDELREFTGQSNLVDEYCKDKIPKIAGSVFGLYNAISMYGSVDSIPWLLSKGFDLFGLIDAGLAIDAATV